jgi:diacylglycerol kinase
MFTRTALAKETEAGRRKPISIEARRAHRSPHTLIPAAWQHKSDRAATLVESFYHAFHGIYIALKEQRNVRIHFCAATLVTVLGFVLKLDPVSWLALAIAIGMVMTAEFLNTALEHLVDLAARGQYHRSARYAKDTAAGAVLIASFVAVITGGVIFLPRLAALLHG